MENNDAIFQLNIDPVIREHLMETQRWTRIFAICGALGMIAIVMAGIYQYALLSGLDSRIGSRFGALRIGVFSGYLFTIIVGIFPVIYLFQFSAQMKGALQNNDQEKLILAFQSMKKYFRYLGIIMVVCIILFGLMFSMGIVASGLRI